MFCRFYFWKLPLIIYWFWGLYLGAIKTGLPRAFRNGMPIGITPKNEVLFYMKWKNLQNSEIVDPPCGIFGVRGYVWGCWTFSMENIWYKNFTQLNFWRMHPLKKAFQIFNTFKLPSQNFSLQILFIGIKDSPWTHLVKIVRMTLDLQQGTSTQDQVMSYRY